MSERIQKLLATAGIASRRAIEDLITEGRVTVNGRPAAVGQKINHDDHVRVDGRLVPLSRKAEAAQVLLYRKKVGELVTREDPEGRKTVFRKLPELESGRWIAVGRLDINTSGLLLLTNDGELARRLMHPSFEMRREYAVRVLGTVDAGVLARLKAGVDLEDGFAKFETIEAGANNATLGEEMDGPANSWWTVTVKQGRNRVVRRLLESQNLQVSRLMRVSYGPIALGRGIKSGSYREATSEELQALLEAVQMQAVKPVKKPRKAQRIMDDAAEISEASEDAAGGRRRHLFRDLDESRPPERSREASSPKSRAAADRFDPRKKPRAAATERGSFARGDTGKPRTLVAQPTPREARFPLPAEGQFRDASPSAERAYKPRSERPDASTRGAGKPAGRPFVRKDAESSSKRSTMNERPRAEGKPRVAKPAYEKREFNPESNARSSFSPKAGSAKPDFKSGARASSRPGSKPDARGSARSTRSASPVSSDRPRADGKPRAAKPAYEKRDFQPESRTKPSFSSKSGGAQTDARPSVRSGTRPDSRAPAKTPRSASAAVSDRPRADGKPRAAKPSYEKRDFNPESNKRSSFSAKPGGAKSGFKSGARSPSRPGAKPDSRGPSKGARSGPPGRRKPKA